MPLGLPDSIKACLFDLDGVLTQTAKVHAAAWKQMFDEYLREHAEREGAEFVEFDIHDDYDRYVDGKPRGDGVRSFLASRGIELPEGSPDDPAEAETIVGLGNRKNDPRPEADRGAGRRALRGLGPVREGGPRRRAAPRRRLLEHELPRRSSRRRASSTCSRRSSTATSREERGLQGQARTGHLPRGRPAGSGSARRRRPCSRTRWPGSRPARAGGFGCVIGVDRVGQAEELAAHGADLVVEDLAELLDEG